MHTNHMGLATHGFRVVTRSAKRLSPVRGEPLGVLRVIPVRESVTHNRIGQTPRVPCVRQVSKGLHPTCDFVDRLCHRSPPSPNGPSYKEFERSHQGVLA